MVREVSSFGLLYHSLGRLHDRSSRCRDGKIPGGFPMALLTIAHAPDTGRLAAWLVRGCGARQDESHQRPATGRVVDLDAAAMLHGSRLDHCQAESEAGALAAWRGAFGERRKHSFALGGWDAWPLIVHFDRQCVVAAVHADAHRLACLGPLDGVVDQVANGPNDGFSVGGQPGVAGALHVEVHALRSCVAPFGL